MLRCNDFYVAVVFSVLLVGANNVLVNLPHLFTCQVYSYEVIFIESVLDLIQEREYE